MSVAYTYETPTISPAEARAQRQAAARVAFDRNHGAAIRAAAATAESVRSLADDLRLPRHQVRGYMLRNNVSVGARKPTREAFGDRIYGSMNLRLKEPTARLHSDPELVALVADWLVDPDTTTRDAAAFVAYRRNNPDLDLPSPSLLAIRFGSFDTAVAFADAYIASCGDTPVEIAIGRNLSRDEHQARIRPLLAAYVADEAESEMQPTYERFLKWMASIGEADGDYLPGYSSWGIAMRDVAPRRVS